MSNQHKGSSFDDFLEEEKLLEEVSAKAQKRLLTLQIADILEESSLTKSEIAEIMQTSRSQLDRLLDPENMAITLESLDRLAQAMGKRLKIEFA